jgi:Transposase DDE domain group 1
MRQKVVMVRLPPNRVLQQRIAHLLTRRVGRPPTPPRVFHASFSYQAQSWRRVVAKVEWRQGELYPRVGFVVTNLKQPAEWVVSFYNGRGTAEQWIREGKAALRWTRIPCRAFRANAAPPAVRACLQPRQPRALACLAGPGGPMVDHDRPQEAGQDRRQDRAPRSLRRVPASGGGGTAHLLRRDPASHRTPAAKTAAAPGMRIESDEHGNPTGEVRPIIDREPPNAAERGAQASGRGSAGPRGWFERSEPSIALERRIVGFQKPATGESRLMGLEGARHLPHSAVLAEATAHMRYVICVRNPLDVAMSTVRQKWCSRERRTGSLPGTTFCAAQAAIQITYAKPYVAPAQEIVT